MEGGCLFNIFLISSYICGVLIFLFLFGLIVMLVPLFFHRSSKVAALLVKTPYEPIIQVHGFCPFQFLPWLIFLNLQFYISLRPNILISPVVKTSYKHNFTYKQMANCLTNLFFHDIQVANQTQEEKSS